MLVVEDFKGIAVEGSSTAPVVDSGGVLVPETPGGSMFFFRNKPLIALFGSDDCTGKKEVTYGSSGGRTLVGSPCS